MNLLMNQLLFAPLISRGCSSKLFPSAYSTTPHARCCPGASSGCNTPVPPTPQRCCSLPPLTQNLFILLWSLFWNPFSIPILLPWVMRCKVCKLSLECFHQLYCGWTACVSFVTKNLKLQTVLMVGIWYADFIWLSGQVHNCFQFGNHRHWHLNESEIKVKTKEHHIEYYKGDVFITYFQHY